MEFLGMLFYYGREHIMVVTMAGSLIGMAILAFSGRIAYNGLWQLPQAIKHTWTTRAGKGTTFVSSRRVLWPKELSSRQKNMGELTYRWPMAVLLIVFMTDCLYTMALG